MPTFGFVIPFRPKCESANWDEVNLLLQHTLTSVLRQTYAQFKIYVVYTDAPEFVLQDSRLQYIAFPYAFENLESLRNRETLVALFKSEQKAVRRWDKGRKLTYGSMLAKNDGCDFIMALDSDDRISKHLLHYFSDDLVKSNCKGWYMDKGYVYKLESRWLLKVPKYMCGLNGSTHMLAAELVTIPDFDSLDWQDFNLFTDHSWLCERIKLNHGYALHPVPRPMHVYVVHASNMSIIAKKEYSFTIKSIVKRLLRSVLITKKKREEFYLVEV